MEGGVPLRDLAGWPHLKAPFLPPAGVAPPPPLLLDDPAICDAHWAEQHALAAGPVGARGCYALEGAVLAGACHVTVEGEVAVAPDLTPTYWRRMLEDGALGEAPHRRDLPVRAVDGPVAVVATLGYGEYGHWLLDILPRLWTLAGARPDLRDVRIALPTDAPAFGAALLARLGLRPEQLLVHDPWVERIAPRLLLLPSLAHDDYRLHPAAAGYFDALAVRHAAPGGGRPRHLFLSRARYGRPGIPGRHLVNHDDVRALLEACGFTTVCPELLPWPEQLALFAGARVVVGEHGSAMKNLLFTPPGAAVVNIHYLNDTQSKIAALRGHHMIYLRGEDLRAAPDGGVEYRVDIPNLARCVAAALGHAGRA